jgi:tetratricopeptide (TPR) repeat protein
LLRPTAGLAIALLLGAAPAWSATRPLTETAAQAYVQGRLALSEDNLDLAAKRFEEALQTDADDVLKRRALDVALLSGDMPTAVRLANRIVLLPESPAGQGMADSIVALTRLAGAAAARDWRAYQGALKVFDAPGRMSDTSPVLSEILAAYGRAAQGDAAGAAAMLDPASRSGIGASYLAEHRAHLLVLARDWPAAADAYAAMVANEAANVPRLRIAAAGAALEAAARDPAYRDKAILLLGGGAERDPLLNDARARLKADPRLEGRKLGGHVARAEEGIALLFLRLASDLGRERVSNSALSFARLGTLVAPRMPDAWLMTSDTLVRAGKPDLALAALDEVPGSEPWRGVADARRAGILVSGERYDEARDLLRKELARPDAGFEGWTRLGDLERRAGNHRAAADAFARALSLLPGEPGALHAQLNFLRGSSLEQAGDWAAAEAALRDSVRLQPENALYLNYLGYSLLDRRQRLPEARDLIARAYKAAPENGAIIDSMGWAEYVLGNYAEAVRLLEIARSAEPADPTVADHLGDALWKAGRRIEARHAWASAAALDPEPKLADVLARKLDYGLDVALASR